MKRLRRLTIADQTAEHLRAGVRDGRWGKQFPGVVRLTAELGVATATVRGDGHHGPAMRASNRKRKMAEPSPDSSATHTVRGGPHLPRCKLPPF